MEHMVAALTKPYLIGARLQIKRYQEAQLLTRESGVLGSYLCLHEVSTLFEDLNTLGIYLKKTGRDHPDNQLWSDCRNNVRHDAREGLDAVEKRKTNRAKRLKIHENLEIEISFNPGYVKIGSTIINMYRIEAYLDWASDEVDQVISDAVNKNLIKAT